MKIPLREIGFSNIAYLSDMYRRWSEDPKAVSASWGAIFSKVEEEPAERGFDPANFYRQFGHLRADISPIHQRPKEAHPTHLEKVYCSNVGVEYKGFVSHEVERWLEERIEKDGFNPPISAQKRQEILTHLNRSELFETFLHTRYPGQKRFSLEGAETLLPMLAFIIERGAELDASEFWIGMSHRGRLNVLSNILGKTYSEIFQEFQEGYVPDEGEKSGDVKYHKGFYSEITLSSERRVEVIVASNPSHLESVGPVIEGKVRARQEKVGGVRPIVPILIHGDAGIAGQGVVYETLQFCRLKGYQTGGTLHLVINNEIGFTTLPEEGRSTLYCTDIAKAFGAPIFHVNAEDVEGAVFVALLAIEMRQKFGIDVFIDLVCYRKYGHNESDEPFFTQPLEYSKIRQKRSIRELYIAKGHVDEAFAKNLESEFKQSLAKALKESEGPIPKGTKRKEGREWNSNPLVKTSVPKEKLQEVADSLAKMPDGFHPHRKVEQLYQERKEMVFKGEGIDWGMGETLAYATLLSEGTHIRISGQDVARGTFSHRQAVLVDQQVRGAFTPLSRLGDFKIYNSPLSEFACLGFEFGYAAQYPEALVIWEAQFGDFANGAQVVIDQYIASSEEKWGQRNGVVLFLPHGYEGQGPEHSSARIERFLALCGKNNMQVVYPTLPSQLFHLLRRQVLGQMMRPLICMTPKALLRHPECKSAILEFSQGSFRPIIDDPFKPQRVRKVALCSGKVYYDLLAHRKEDVALVRIEELYPFPQKELEEILKGYQAKEVVWVQEEPENMGPCWYIHQEWKRGALKGIDLHTIARERSASPAVGSPLIHQKELKSIIESLYES